MQISLLGKILDLLFPRYCLICGSRLQGSEEMLCTSCISTLPRTDTWKNPYENEMAKIFWAHIPIERCASLFYYQSHSPASQAIYALKYGDRQENVEHAFRLAPFYHDEKGRKYPTTDLAGKHILIVDDVCTTGATVIACCKELMKAGKMKFSFTSVGWTKE